MSPPPLRAAQLRAAELFGPTFQGEGPSAGQLALFVRLAGCGVGCSYCDEPGSWDWTRYDRDAETTLTTAGDILDWAAGIPAELAVITGGEPLAQRRALAELAAGLAGAGKRVEIETSGTIAPGTRLCEPVSLFSVSPKLAFSEVPYARRIRPRALEALAATGKAVFKFVARGEEDLDEAGELADRFGLAPVWIMPEGTRSWEVLATMRELAEPVLARGWNLTGRGHVLLWENARGR